MIKELSVLKDEFISICNGSPWYGENMITILNKVISSKAYNNRIPGKHSVIEILYHIIYWRLFTISRFEQQQNIEHSVNNNWQEIEIADEQLWQKTITQFEFTQQKLLFLLDTTEDDILERIVPDRTYNFRFLLNGTIQHDIYHIAQISYCL